MSYEKKPEPSPASLKRILLSPCTGQSVWPDQCCPGFSARPDISQRTMPMCRFCKYTVFPPKAPGVPEVGMCQYPEEQTDSPGESGEPV